MRRRVLSVLLLAAAIAAVVAAPASGALETIMQDDAALLHRPAEEVAVSAQRMKELGADRVRMTASWSSITRDADSATRPGFDATDPAAYEQARFSRLDTAVRAAHAAGLSVLIDVGFWAPVWATSEPSGPRARTNIDPQAFADFATALARRYSGAFTPPAPAGEAPPSQDEQLLDRIFGPPRALKRTFRAAPAGEDGPLPRVDSFALWNEPNHQGLLLPQWEGSGAGARPVSPAHYRAMVQSAYPAIKAVRPDAMVLIANTSSTGGTRGSGPVPPLEFLRELACVDVKLRPRSTPDCASFAAVPGDGWAHHPYSQNEHPARRSRRLGERDDARLADLPTLARTLSRLVKAGRLAPGNGNIYLTEFGYETERVPGRPRISQATQARWLTWAEYLADRVPAVRSFAQFLLRDQAKSAERVSASESRPYGEFSTGLLTASGREKVAARTFLAGLFARRADRRRTMLYGRLRLGPGVKRIDLQRRAGRSGWRRIARLRVGGRAAFRRTVRHRPGARYRLTYPGARGKRLAGLSVVPVAATSPRR